MCLKVNIFTAITFLFYVTQSEDTYILEDCSLCTSYYPDGSVGQSSDRWGNPDPLTDHACSGWGKSDTGGCCTLNDVGICAIFNWPSNAFIYPCGGCPPLQITTVSPTYHPTPVPTRSPIECPYNTFRYSNTSECFECNADDIGYECQGASTVKVEYGYWISAQTKNGHDTELSPLQMINNSYSDNLILSLRCPVGKCCANHAGCDYFTPGSLCATNRNMSSVTCSRCDNDSHELLGSATCGECKQTNYGLVSILFVIALVFALVLLFILSRPTHLLSNIKEINWRKVVAYDRKSLVFVLMFKIYLYYYQGLSQILFVKNITPNSQFAKFVLTLFDFDMSLFSVSSDSGFCLIAGIQSGIYELLISYMWYVFIAINVIIIAFASRCLCRRRNASCKPYIKTGCITMILITAGPLLSISFKFLTCIKVGDRYYHFYDAEIACYEYIWVCAGLLPAVILCGVLLRLWFVIYKQDASQRENETNPYRSLTRRFKNNMWYWEFVLFIRRFGIAALTSFYDLADQMTSILLVSFIVLLFALQTKFTPFKHQRANMVESMCLFATVSIVIALIVMEEGTTAMSWYLTLLIITPLLIVCLIIIDIFYKSCTFEDLPADKESDSFLQIKQRWFEKEAETPNKNAIEMQVQVTSHITTKQQIEHADTVQQLMVIIETMNFSDLKQMLLQYCDENQDVNERIPAAKTMTFDGEFEDSDTMVKTMDQDMVYFKHDNRSAAHDSILKFSIASDIDGETELSADLKEENEELGYHEVELVNTKHIVLVLYQKLDKYLKYKSDENGKGIMVQRMKRNEYGTALYAQYGFNESDEWFVESIDGNNVTNTSKGDIDGILNRVDVNQGYEVVFKKRMKSVKNVSKKLKQIKKSKDWADRSQHLLDDEQSVQRSNATLTEDM
eukprot:170808_1